MSVAWQYRHPRSSSGRHSSGELQGPGFSRLRAGRESDTRRLEGIATLMWHAVVAALVLGAASTVGDMLWAGLSLRHLMAYGLAHGALICLCIGAVVGWRARRLLPGLAAGPLIGLLAAGAFYLMAPALGYYAMFPAWMLFWICFALLQGLLGRDQGWQAPLARGLVAALLSGAAFYAISGIWTGPSRRTPNYLYNVAAWTFAFLPGFAALFVERWRR